jgi:pimeloyl-ACP methyl ester carboxylesterase
VTVESAGFGKVDVHYREVGSGPPLLLVHGLMTSSYSWRYVLHELGRDFRVIAPDLPGAGRSGKPPVRYSASTLAAFVAEFQRALGIHGCAAVGNSLGGYICMRTALADTAAFSRLVSIHPPAIPALRYRVMHALLSLPPVRWALSWWIRRAPRRWAHRNVHYYDESLKSLEEVAVYGDPLASAEGARALIHYLRDTFRPRDFADFIDELERRRSEGHPFPVPLLLMYAREDPVVPRADGEALQRLLPQTELHWLERTSHFAHVDTPEPVLRLVREFMG